ncbi:MAG: hypothetical protein KA116_07030 [Proteobacteria bacterium]|nr:hypothetical protein [Pseudomonadota bacterium]
MNCHHTKFWGRFYVAVLLLFFIARCGVKLPPKANHDEVGPHELLEKDNSNGNTR